MENGEIVKCKNCGAESAGTFCTQCGQKLHLTPINFYAVILEFLSTAFNFEGPFFKTLWGLFINPGKLIRAFLAGNRKKYYAPIRYLVVCLFINLLLSEIIDFNPIENQKAMDSNAANYSENQSKSYAIGNFVAENLNYFLFILPFIISLYSKLFYWSRSYNMAERTVMGFYLAGQYIALSIIPILLSKVNPAFFKLFYLFSIVYLAYASYSFHRGTRKIVDGVKAIIMSPLYIISYYVFSYLLAIVVLKIQGKI